MASSIRPTRDEAIRRAGEILANALAELAHDEAVA